MRRFHSETLLDLDPPVLAILASIGSVAVDSASGIDERDGVGGDFLTGNEHRLTVQKPLVVRFVGKVGQRPAGQGEDILHRIQPFQFLHDLFGDSGNMTTGITLLLSIFQ